MLHRHPFNLLRLIGLLWQVLAKNNPRHQPSTALHRFYVGGVMAMLMLIAPPIQAQLADGPNGAVNAIVKGADGTTYLGGAFTGWGPQTGGGALLGASDGAVNRAFPKIIGTITASVADGSGGFYIGGTFTSVGGVARNNLAQIDSTGAVTNWNPNANNTVYALAISGSTVYAGGGFTSIGGTSRYRLAAIGTNGTLASWNPSANAEVTALAISGSTVYAGGVFTTMGGTTRNRLAAIGTGGTLSTTWNPNASGTVNALAISGSTVYAGGSFANLCTSPSSCTGQIVAPATNVTRNNLAAIDTNGTLSTTWDPNANSTVSALAISGSTVYAGGSFTTIGVTTRNRVAAIGTDGVLSTTWDPNANSTVSALAISGSTVYAGGVFTTMGGTTRNYLAAIGTDGVLSTTWDPNANSTVSALAISGSTVYAGGVFTTMGGTTRNYLAAIGTDGTLSTTWNPNANFQVNALVISGSTVYAGGNFTRIGVTNVRNRLAAIGTNGTLASWNPSTNPNGSVSALAISGSTVYVAGYFTLINNINRNRLAAIGTDGNLTTWNPNANNNVYALAINGSTVYAGGDFTNLCTAPSSCTGQIVSPALNVTRNRLAAIGTDGTLSTTWNPNVNSTVSALAISGSTVYAGGIFLNLCASPSSCTGQIVSPAINVTRNRLAAIGTNGILSTTWDPNANNSVTALAISGSTVYAGGAFTSIASQTQTNSPTSYLAQLNALPCSSGVPITTGTAGVGALWQMLALPCVPTSGTIAGTFGTGTSSNLNTATYASTTPTTSPYGWIIEDRTVGAIPAYVPLLTSDISLSTGIGYWLKSYQAPTNGTLTMEGTATPTDVTQAQGCYSANGCKAITVTAYTTVGSNRYNLVGNPFPYNVEWSKVRIRVDGSASTLTPTQANTANIVSNTVNIWNDTGTGYNSLKDVAPSPATPNLQYFKSFWVNVLPGAVGHTVELLIPAEQSTLSYLQAAPDQLAQTATLESMPTVEMPWYLGWLDLVVSPAAAAPLPAVSDHVNPQKLPYLKDWYIRLKLDNPVTGWKDHGMLLGQLSDANLGFDRHDIAKMAPFTAPYLSLVFIHPDWGLKAADYASNFHPYSSTVDVWHFQIHADPVGSIVYLSWEGSPALLTRSRLIEVSTGKVILANDPLWKSKGYPITLTSTVQDYIWRVLP